MRTAFGPLLRRVIVLVIAVAAPLAPSASSAQTASDCVQEGGRDPCLTPQARPFQHALCDEAGSFQERTIAWCITRDGTWMGNQIGCLGWTPDTEENTPARAKRFGEALRAFRGAANPSCSISSDTGWGQPITSSQCFSGAPAYDAGFLVRAVRRMAVACNDGTGESIVGLKSRGLECPVGYTSKSTPRGTACTRRLEPCDERCALGNPITPSTGVKVQTEVDYRHAKGLEFSRHYHSLRFYEPFTTVNESHSENRLGTVWRSNFDKRVIPIPGSAFVVAGLTLPSGEVQYFDGAGNEIYNYRGARAQLVSVPGTGWFLRAPESVEFYGTDGRLRSITLRTGQAFTLSYSDGTTGPNGGLAVDGNGNPGTLALPAGILTRVTDSHGNALSFASTAEGRIVVMTDPAGGRYVFAYDTASNLTSVKYPDERLRSYRYNEPANMVGGASLPHALTSIVDENNVVFASFKYDTSGRAVETQHAGAVQRYALTYNANGTTSATDPLGTMRSFAFQTVDGLSRYTGASLAGGAGFGSGVKELVYDTAGNKVSQTDFNDIKTCYAYDTARNLETLRVEGVPAAADCASLTSGGAALPQGSRKVVTEWHARWRQPLRLSEPGRRTTFAYNGDAGASCAPSTAIIADGSAQGQAIGVVCSKTVQATDDSLSGAQGFDATLQGSPRSWAYTYDSVGNVLTLDGPRTGVSDVTTSTYYASDDPEVAKRGNLASVTNAASHRTDITAYNAHGQPLTIVDPNSLTTTLTYDARQRLKTRTVGSELTSYDYDDAGQLTKVTLPDGSFLSYGYDDAHRLTSITDNQGNRIAYVLDAMGNRTLEEVFDPASQLAQKRSRVYSNLNRLFQELGALNQTTEYGYDDQGNVTSVKDPLNRITSNQYDALNRLKQVTSPAPVSAVTQYGYNGLDALTQVTDPRSLVTGYTVDGLGNLNQQSSPDTGTTTNTYDAAGNLLKQTDAKGQETNYAYDALNRVSLITFHDGSKQAYAYDLGTNGIGRLSSITETDPSNQQTSLIQYAYTPHGRVASETRTVAGVAYVLGYGYDPAGRLTGLTYPSGRTLAYSFDGLGRVSAINTTFNGETLPVVSGVAYHPFGAVKGYTLGNGQAYTRGYDHDGRINSYTLGAKTFSIGYDAASRIEFINEFGNPANSNTYGYDELDRLTSAGIPGTSYGYTYDAVGNRRSKTAGAATDTLDYGTTSNRIATLTPASGPPRSFVFDPNGSTTNDGLTTYAYDVRGRMVQATSVIGATGYQVNALGQRIRKTNSQGDTVFHYDTQGRLIAETSPAGALKRELIYLGDIPVGVLQ